MTVAEGAAADRYKLYLLIIALPLNHHLLEIFFDGKSSVVSSKDSLLREPSKSSVRI